MSQIVKRFGQSTAAPSPAVYWFTMIILMSRIVWYDFRIIAAQADSLFDVVFAFTIWSVILTPIFLWYIGRALVEDKIDTFSWMYLILIIYSTATGLILGNEMNYILAEIVKYMFIPAMYIATKRMIFYRGCEYIIKNTFIIVTFFVFVRFFLYWYISGSIERIRYGGVQEIFSLCVLAAYWIASKDTKNFAFGTILFIAITSLIIIGEKRTSMASVGLVAIICLSIVLFSKRFGKMFFLIYGSIAAAIVGIFLLWFFQIDLLGSRAVAVTSLELKDLDETRRALEIQYIYEDLKNNLWVLIFGRGGGVSFYLPFFYTRFVDDIIHSVHFTLGAMLLRHGIFGLFIYFFTFLFGLFISAKIVLASEAPPRMAMIAFTVISYKLVALFASITIFGGVDDALIGVTTAVAVYNSKEWNILRGRPRRVPSPV